MQQIHNYRNKKQKIIVLFSSLLSTFEIGFNKFEMKMFLTIYVWGKGLNVFGTTNFHQYLCRCNLHSEWNFYKRLTRYAFLVKMEGMISLGVLLKGEMNQTEDPPFKASYCCADYGYVSLFENRSLGLEKIAFWFFKNLWPHSKTGCCNRDISQENILANISLHQIILGGSHTNISYIYCW